jgi:hypothetical protein
LHLATDPNRRSSLQGDSRFFVSPHHGFRGWIAINLRERDVEWSEIEELLELAYREVASKELVAELDRDRCLGV